MAKFYDALCTLQYSIKQILKITTTKIKNLQKFPKSPKFQKNIKIPIDFPVEPSGKIFFNENIKKNPTVRSRRSYRFEFGISHNAELLCIVL